MRARLYGAGLAGTLIAALVLPWAHYGGIAVALGRLPWWGLYAVAAVALQVTAALFLRTGPRRPPAALVAALAAATAVAAVLVLSFYDEPVQIFGPGVVPLVVPSPGWGGPVAIVAALVTGAVTLVGRRAETVRGEPSGSPRISH